MVPNHATHHRSLAALNQSNCKIKTTLTTTFPCWLLATTYPKKKLLGHVLRTAIHDVRQNFSNLAAFSLIKDRQREKKKE